MNFLAIDTTMETLAIALSINGKDITQTIETDKKKHNATLLPAIDGILDEYNASIKDIDIFGVVVGPGSFTGIRVGVAAINAFAFAMKKKVIEVTSLELGRVDNENEDILSLIDCRHNNFYAGLFQKDKVEYMAITKKEADKIQVKHILCKNPSPNSLLKIMKQKIDNNKFSEKAKPFYLKKSSAERENGL